MDVPSGWDGFLETLPDSVKAELIERAAENRRLGESDPRIEAFRINLSEPRS